MAFEEVKENVEDLKRQAQELLDANIRYYKLYAFSKTAKYANKIIKFTIAFLLLWLAVLFLSVALAIGIGQALNNLVYGFLITGLLYIVIAVIMVTVYNRIIPKRVLAKLSRKFFKNQD